MSKLKRLHTFDEVHEYIKHGRDEAAIFLPFSVDFSIMKHVRNSKELSNVVYFWDVVLGTSDVVPSRIYLDYAADTPFQDDIQIYNNGIIKNSETVGQIFANEAGLISLTFDGVSHIYDPRGFKVAEVVGDSNSQIIYVYKGDKCAYILMQQLIFDAESGNIFTYESFQEVILSGF